MYNNGFLHLIDLIIIFWKKLTIIIHLVFWEGLYKLYTLTSNWIHMMKTAASAWKRLQQSDGSVFRAWGQVVYNAAQFFNFVFFYYVYIVWTVISTIFVIINFCGWSKPYSFKVILNHRLRPKQLYYLLSFLWIDLAMKFMKIGVSTNGWKKQYFILSVLINICKMKHLWIQNFKSSICEGFYLCL